jgi:glycosyltransferase involved in cell wall biosynthesis
MELDLSHFDTVITTKYPAWMIRHPNKIVYMQHPSRGVYDLYRGPADYHSVCDTPSLLPLAKLLDAKRYDYEDAKKIITLALSQKGDSAFAFPGPLSRAIIHYLDRTALLDASRHFAISHTVASRPDYFPPHIRPEVLHHPSSLPYFKSGGQEYIFTASRLEELKRIHLLIQAYQQTSTDLPFYIAGTGGQEAQLKKMAGGDPRIKFLGFVSDQELIELYANALFVPFVPYQEDYGLITIEAMMSQKPVLTTHDSGGVAEMVRHGHNGCKVDPTPQAISKAMQEMLDHKQTTIDMGIEAKKSVSHITWERLVRHFSSPSRPKSPPSHSNSPLLVLSTFRVYPPQSGGQNRIYYLYKHLASMLHFPIYILTIADASRVPDGVTSWTRQIAPNLHETAIPYSFDAISPSLRASRYAFDVIFGQIASQIPHYKATIKSLDPRAIILEQPYAIELVQDLSLPIIYDSHNVEYDLKRSLLPREDEHLLGRVFELERQALFKSRLAAAVSWEDIARYKELYSYQKPMLHLPNGVDLESIVYTSVSERRVLKKRYGIDKKIALFMGSDHGPNVEGARAVLELAKKKKEYIFLILGSVANAFGDTPVPKNVAFTGVLSHAQKQRFLSMADVALNPITSGGGSNLKLLEYLAAGLPVVSTPFGARGFEDLKKYITIAELESFAEAMQRVESVDPRIREELRRYDFATLAKKLFYSLGELGLMPPSA